MLSQMQMDLRDIARSLAITLILVERPVYHLVSHKIMAVMLTIRYHKINGRTKNTASWSQRFKISFFRQEIYHQTFLSWVAVASSRQSLNSTTVEYLVHIFSRRQIKFCATSMNSRSSKKWNMPKNLQRCQTEFCFSYFTIYVKNPGLLAIRSHR